MKNRYIAIIYKSILNHEKVSDIHKRLLNETINSKMKVSKRLLNYMYALTINAKKLDEGKGNYVKVKAVDNVGRTGKSLTAGLDILAVGFLKLINDKAVNYQANKLINEQIQNEQETSKRKIIDNSLNEAKVNKKIFFVASKHSDSAKDHEDAQGKIYIHEEWESIITDTELKERIRFYLYSHPTTSVQDIMRPPVYFITRPNCRHYFTQYTAEDILKGNYKISTRKMGNWKLKTPKSSELEYLRDRLSQLNSMYAIRPTKELKILIDKMKMLIKRKEEYIRTGK